MVKNLPAKQEQQETWVRSLGWEDLEEGMATHYSILAWRIPWTEEPGGIQSIGSQRVRHNCSDLSTHAHTGSLLPHVGSNSLAREQTQAPCIGNPESWPLDHLPALNFLKAPSNRHLELKIPGLIWRDPLCNRLVSSRNTILYSLKHFFSEILQASWYLILMFF